MADSEPGRLEDIVDLAVIDRELRQQDSYMKSGHTARPVLRKADLRIVLIAMKEGSRMPEHRVEETISIQVVRGHVRLGLPERAVEVQDGQVLILDRAVPHDVDALRESLLLVTFGWKAR
jgi:quercetin dioxygenase-like cupin family protein